MFENYKKQYEQLWKMFIRPYRQTYFLYDLGPKSQLVHNKFVKRHDIELKNERNLTLQCSYFEIFDTKSEFSADPNPDKNCIRPCVIYLHCNATSRLEGIQLLPYLVDLNINLFCFDFSGSGLSEGEYVSLGIYESQDLKVVVDYVRKNFGIKQIGLWGRSMGAVTALRYASIDNKISCVLSDSPFSDLRKLALDFAKERSKVPSFLVKGALGFVKRSIKKRANFNIKDLDQTKLVKKCIMPIVFVTSKEDNFVKAWHTENLYDLYPGEKKLVYMKGDHNATRPKEFYKEGALFFKENLQNKHLNVHLDNKIGAKNDNINKILIDEEYKINTNEQKLTFVKEKDVQRSEKRKHSSIERNRIFMKKTDNEDASDDDSFERRKSAENLEKFSIPKKYEDISKQKGNFMILRKENENTGKITLPKDSPDNLKMKIRLTKDNEIKDSPENAKMKGNFIRLTKDNEVKESPENSKMKVNFIRLTKDNDAKDSPENLKMKGNFIRLTKENDVKDSPENSKPKGNFIRLTKENDGKDDKIQNNNIKMNYQLYKDPFPSKAKK